MKYSRSIILLSLLLVSCANNGGETPSSSEGNEQSLPSTSIVTPSNSGDTSMISKKYSNPVYQEQSIADPSVYRDPDGSMYVYGTGGAVLKTTDGVNYEEVARVQRTEKWGPSNHAIWAPDVIKIGDTFNYYYSNSNC